MDDMDERREKLAQIDNFIDSHPKVGEVLTPQQGLYLQIVEFSCAQLLEAAGKKLTFSLTDVNGLVKRGVALAISAEPGFVTISMRVRPDA